VESIALAAKRKAREAARRTEISRKGKRTLARNRKAAKATPAPGEPTEKPRKEGEG